MTCYRIGDLAPTVHPTAYLAPQSTIIGQVELHAHASVWPGAVIRADNERIVIGEGSNVQESAVMHVDPGKPLTLGRRVTVGHQAMLHGCTIGDGALIGIQAVVLNGAIIGEESLVGAGTLVTEGKVFPPRSLILGSPARVVRALTDADIARLRATAESYIQRSQLFRDTLTVVEPSHSPAGPGVAEHPPQP